MAVREVLRMGDPRLFEVSAPWGPSRGDDLDKLITDMFDTMAALVIASLGYSMAFGTTLFDFANCAL